MERAGKPRDRTPFNAKTTMEWVLPPRVTVIGRMDLLKYILTCNPKTKRDSVIGEYIGRIKSLYPAVEKVETMFKEFHSLLMGIFRHYFFCYFFL